MNHHNGCRKRGVASPYPGKIMPVTVTVWRNTHLPKDAFPAVRNASIHCLQQASGRWLFWGRRLILQKPPAINGLSMQARSSYNWRKLACDTGALLASGELFHRGGWRTGSSVRWRRPVSRHVDGTEPCTCRPCHSAGSPTNHPSRTASGWQIQRRRICKFGNRDGWWTGQLRPLSVKNHGLLPWMNTRPSRCNLRPRPKASRSMILPFRRNLQENPCDTRMTSCSMMGPSSRSSVTVARAQSA